MEPETIVFAACAAIWVMLDYLQRHPHRMGWNDFEFTAVREIGGRR